MRRRKAYGFISQVIAREEPQLVPKIILAGTGPAGGTGIDKVTSVTIRDMVKGQGVLLSVGVRTTNLGALCTGSSRCASRVRGGEVDVVGLSRYGVFTWGAAAAEAVLPSTAGR